MGLLKYYGKNYPVCASWIKEETHYDFGARIYNSKVARWLSLDPLAHEYPDLSDYLFVAGNPIMYIDIDGRKIGNPESADFKYVEGILQKTEKGREILKNMHLRPEQQTQKHRRQRHRKLHLRRHRKPRI